MSLARKLFLTLLGTVISFGAGSLPAQAAQAPTAAASAPAAVVRNLYKLHKQGRGGLFSRAGRKAQQQYFDQSLADLLWRNLTEPPAGEPGNLDFDPLYYAQDFRITRFRVGQPNITGDRATVVVSFNNFGRPTRITYKLHQTGPTWKIENIIYGRDFDLVKILSSPY